MRNQMRAIFLQTLPSRYHVCTHFFDQKQDTCISVVSQALFFRLSTLPASGINQMVFIGKESIKTYVGTPC